MIICAAQTKPMKGDVEKNIADHVRFIETAVSHNTNLIIFPELSLTGYEPSLAQERATTQEDGRLDIFQTLSNTHQITIGVGIPTKSTHGLHISMVLFQPSQPRQTYSKKYLHADEEPFFVSGKNFPTVQLHQTHIAPAICYEISIAQHAEDAHQHGAEIYAATVAKSAQGVAQANQRLAQIAKQYAMPVLMSNCVGPSEDFVSAGNTAVWDKNGNLLAQLDNTHVGFIIYNSKTNHCHSNTTATVATHHE